jgi:hypothetical protein
VKASAVDRAVRQEVSDLLFGTPPGTHVRSSRIASGEIPIVIGAVAGLSKQVFGGDGLERSAR